MLTTKQARENQEKYGFNELVEGKKKSTMQIFLEQFKDFLVIILIISAVISGILGDAESAIVIFVVITMNAILGTVQTVKAEQSLNSLKQLSAPEAKVASAVPTATSSRFFSTAMLSPVSALSSTFRLAHSISFPSAGIQSPASSITSSPIVTSLDGIRKNMVSMNW